MVGIITLVDTTLLALPPGLKPIGRLG